MSSATRFAAGMVSLVALALVAGVPAATAASPLTCNATVLSVNAAGIPLNVGQAGTPGGACGNAAQSVDLNPAVPLGVLNVGATTKTAAARTTVTNGGAPIAADARLESANVNVGGLLGTLNITADVIESHVEGGCINDYSTSGQVANLKINGTAISANTPNVNTPLGVASVEFNKVTRTATGASRDAVRVSILNLVTVVLGHAEAGGGDSCPGGTTPPTDTVGTPPSDGVSGGSGTAIPVPPGATPPVNVTTPTNGTNASTCAKINMWFVPRQKNTDRYLRHPGPKSITTGIEHGVRHVTRGRITDCKGKPIIRARIDVFHVIKGGKLRKTGIRSRRDGLLTLILPSNLHTRTIQFEYRPNLKGKKVAARTSVKKVLKRNGRTLY